MSDYDDQPTVINDQLVLIGGKSATGKSASLRNIRNQDRWLYLNTEAGKRLPFRNEFANHRITDPWEVHDFFDAAIAEPSCEGIVIDSLTFLMDMFESKYVIGAANTQQAWGSFAQFFKVLMQEKVARFGKPVLILAHTKSDLNEQTHTMETAVPIKGSLRNNGVEAYFSTVVAAKTMAVKDLEPYKNSSLLSISEDDEELGFKHVFQTRLTKQTVGERVRSPMGMFNRDQTFMDNDAQILLDHLQQFYGS